MKESYLKKKNNFLKKFFIKICRFFNFEIIDQANFYLPLENKSGEESLSVLGKKSITIPMGKIEIKRPVNNLDIIFRSCSSVNMLSQNKKRLFEKEKSEYTLRSLNSIVKSLNHSKEDFENIKIKITVVDHNSPDQVIKSANKILSNNYFDFEIFNLDISKFENEINKINEQKNNVSINQISNMSNIHQSILFAKKCSDLVYFVEDDYIHSIESFKEIISTYEKFSTILEKDIFLCPADYPYLYNYPENTRILIGDKKHWRIVNQTLCTFLTSQNLVNKYFKELTSMCKFEHYPFEKPLHNIYKKEYCFSPIPSLAMHCTNINSIYGLPPNFNLEKVWDENAF
tara:strand:+ start:37 stop:1065 length:1029 start_codon:yes stop_codon:yes gene_type:complete